jgi:PTH1 family peptidyl-tRNA hydrolase
MSSFKPFLIVGLGNPGASYTFTRHNVGFLVLDHFAFKLNTSWSLKKRYALAQASFSSPLILLKPLEYMNLSGFALKEVALFYKIPLEQIIVFYDDIDFPLKKVRLKWKGSSGGHNGIKSIIKELGSDQFVRVRIGINNDFPQKDLANFVLQNFSKEEKEILEKEIFPQTWDPCRS